MISGSIDKRYHAYSIACSSKEKECIAILHKAPRRHFKDEILVMDIGDHNH